jgi:Putative papain-like cysteine peptidase (DUF1796)
MTGSAPPAWLYHPVSGPPYCIHGYDRDYLLCPICDPPEVAIRFISLGLNCFSAAAMDRVGLDRAQCPFDWLSVTIPMVIECIEDDFVKLLDRQYYEPVPQPDGTVQYKHTGYQTPWAATFSHFDPNGGSGRYYLERCIERFRDIMASDEPKTFLFVTQIFPFEQQRFEADFVRLYRTLVERSRNVRVIGITVVVTDFKPGFVVGVDLGESKLLHYAAEAHLAGIKTSNPTDGQRIDAFLRTLGPTKSGHVVTGEFINREATQAPVQAVAPFRP